MTDRELLELAAKAAGLPVEFDGDVNSWYPCGRDENGDVVIWWNPLISDGDALRLAIKMGVNLSLPSSPNQVFVQVGERGQAPFVLERIDGNPISATRRAIVRAAAEIGKEME